MGIPYLDDQPWSSWTRDERFFCSVLYSYAQGDAAALANWLIATTDLSGTSSTQWDLGYEVCFYRDYLWHRGGETAAAQDLPRKRTYDLCLFGDQDLVIIEAKVCEAFDPSQNREFEEDKSHIARMLGLAAPRVHSVALASSRYFENARPTSVAWACGHLTWAHVADKYASQLLWQADMMYGAKRQSFFETV